ncbi:MAG TPA: S41 family peptidase [Candidatus Limnocylindria bacterium]
MIRLASLIAAIALVVGCAGTPTPATGSPSPTATVDIKKTKLNTAYAAMSDQDVHRASSKQILEGAIAALKAEAQKTGGKTDFATLELQDTVDTVFPDFQKFADAVSDFARRNPQISPDRIADVAIEGMMSASPDCHTYYVDKSGSVHRSRSESTGGTPPQIPAGGTSLGGPDQTGLQAKLLDKGVVYITWKSFLISGTYRITDEVKKILDKGVAAGAKAWVFDLRGNNGGNGADLMASWFLNGEPTLKVQFRTGKPDTQSANKDLRLPAEYQLPIAVILNGTGGSAPEVFAAWLKENKRATIVGSRSVGCLGATSPTSMPDGSLISVTVQEFSGANTGTPYNNHGIDPDVTASDSDAVAKAIEAVTK